MPAISSGLTSISSRAPPDADGDIFEQDIWDEQFESSANDESDAGSTGAVDRSGTQNSRGKNRSEQNPLVLPHRKPWDLGATLDGGSRAKSRPQLPDSASPSSTLSFLDSTTNSRYTITPSKMIPHHSTATPAVYQPGRRQSAPVSIPVWKFSEAANPKPRTQADDSSDEDEDEDEDDDGDEDGDDSEEKTEEKARMVPPHELLAREYSKSVTFSVYEGAGRTLRGRDLDGFRNSIMRQTGFLD